MLDRDTALALKSDFEELFFREDKTEPKPAMEQKFTEEMFHKNFPRPHEIAIKAFLLGRKRKFQNYSIRKGGTELWITRKKNVYKRSGLLAKKIGGIVIGNSSGLQLDPGGRLIGKPLASQERLGELVPMVPFTVLKDADLDIESLSIVEKAPEEQIKVEWRSYNYQTNRYKTHKRVNHFTGALLFKVKGRVFGNEAFYLFDIDRNDVAAKKFNPFLSKLPSKAKTIEEAYKLLKPSEVYQYERFTKKVCKRHGEWFFIPVKGNFKPLRQQGGRIALEGELKSKGNRPHFAANISKEGYVRGRIRHGGYEHADLRLPCKWHKAIPNNAVESFKITGVVD